MNVDAAALGEVTLEDAAGAPVKVASIWAERPAILVFLRHFGWLLCREHAAEFRPHEQRLREAGINLVFISVSKGMFAQDFVEKMALTLPVWVDPKLVTYKLLGFERNSISPLVDLRAAPNAVRALAKGFMQGRTAGDPNQHGGVVVVKKGGEPVYAYASKVAGDMPPTAEVLEKARSLT